MIGSGLFPPEYEAVLMILVVPAVKILVASVAIQPVPKSATKVPPDLLLELIENFLCVNITVRRRLKKCDSTTRGRRNTFDQRHRIGHTWRICGPLVKVYL